MAEHSRHGRDNTIGHGPRFINRSAAGRGDFKRIGQRRVGLRRRSRESQTLRSLSKIIDLRKSSLGIAELIDAGGLEISFF